mmetsp:Transcript_76144/g.223236  ORF Transcript_76144/g.223236 Transcript_76144/m.223236 type:complete len:283 (+) Transcript_76144:58-906(+)
MRPRRRGFSQIFGVNLCLPAMSVRYCLRFAKTCLVLSVLEILSASVLVGSVLIGVGLLERQRNVRQEGWYLAGPIFVNMARIPICCLAVRRIAYRMENPQAEFERHFQHLGMLSIWWCFITSIGVFQYYVTQSLLWSNDPLSVGILAAFGAANLLCASGWLSFIKAQYQAPPPPPLNVFLNGRPGRPRLRLEGSCLVCLGDFEGSDVIGQLPCGHGFHRRCIEEWLAVRPQCPLRCLRKKRGSGGRWRGSGPSSGGGDVESAEALDASGACGLKEAADVVWL